MNFRALATELGDALKWDASLNKIDRFVLTILTKGDQETAVGLTGHQSRVGHGGIVGAFGSCREEGEAVAICWKCAGSHGSRMPF